jgi:glycosyltransferase involved in cell wall biosynthesis
MTEPLVSIVMGAYNEARFLQDALDGILNQTFTDIELIVVDDGSSDETPALLSRYADQRLVCIRNPQNLGLTRSLISAVGVARGQLIARHDADDVSHPDRLRQQVAFFNSHPEVGLLGTAYYVISEDGRVLDLVRLPADDARLRERLQRGNPFCHGTVMLRRTALEQAGGYRAEFPVTQDYDLWLRVAEHTRLACLTTPLYQFRIHRRSISRQRRDQQLAYKQLAQELANQRAAAGNETSIPENVLVAYPPDPEKLYQDLRNNAYLYYASGDADLAAACLEETETVRDLQTGKANGWAEWSLDRAHQMAHLQNNQDTGAAFIAWIHDTLAHRESVQGKESVLARYWAEQAFRADRYGPRNSVPGAAWRAVRHDWRWLRNRGLLAIAVRALLTRTRGQS